MGILSLFRSSPPPPPEGPDGPSDLTASNAPPEDTDETRSAREGLVERVARAADPYREGRPFSPRVLDALRAVPRHFFIPGAPIPEAYADHPVSIGLGQTISQPTIVAIMTDALELEGTERVLEIGTGCGYQAAVLSRVAREVWSMEILEPLAELARLRLAALGCDNVNVRVGSGYEGWPEEAPFDRIILTAAPPALPARLPLQLAEGGRLVAPIGAGDSQRLYRWTRRGYRLDEEDLGAVRFVPMVPAPN